MLEFDFKLQNSSGGEAVAELREIARAATPSSEPRQRAGDVGKRFERSARAFAAQLVFVKPTNQRQSCLDRGAVGQGRGNIGAEQASSPGGDAAVNLAEQAPGDTAGRGASQLEALAGRAIDLHMRRARDPLWRVEQNSGAFLGRIQVREETSGGREFGARRRADAVQRRQPEPRLQRSFAGDAVEAIMSDTGADAWDSCLGDHLGCRQSREIWGELAGDTRDQTETDSRNVG